MRILKILSTIIFVMSLAVPTFAQSSASGGAGGAGGGAAAAAAAAAAFECGIQEGVPLSCAGENGTLRRKKMSTMRRKSK